MLPSGPILYTAGRDSRSTPEHMTELRRETKRRRRQAGFSLALIAVTATVMIGMMGLAFDLGRMFILKSELQTFVDTAALGAVRELDGTGTSVMQAHTTATQGPLGTTRPNALYFDTVDVTGVTDTYSTAFNGTYDNYTTAQGNAANTYRFIKVTASSSTPMYFMGVIPGVASSYSLTATAIGGQEQTSYNFNNGGLAPFSPDAHNAADTRNFGLVPNQQYTLKWGNGNTTTCAGDAGFSPGNAPSDHGFVDLGQGNGNSNLRLVIVFGGYPNANSDPNHVSVGDTLGVVPGDRGASIFSALAERSNQDPDQTSTTWEQYKSAGTGNGRRVITAAINDPTLAAGNGSNRTIQVIGFGNFLIDPANTISGSSGPICATYIGPASLTGNSSGGTSGTSVYRMLLFQ
jgi:Flp pilus assembly protein TadG